MKIDRKLNLVIPVDQGERKLYVHSTPISQEIFEEHFLMIGRTWSGIISGGLNWHTGPRFAYLMLKQTATQLDMWDQVEATLMAEIKRLTTVIVPGQGQMLWDEAVAKKLLNSEDVSEVLNIVVFFTVASKTLRREQAGSFLESAANLWNAQITSLSPTEFENSLRTANANANTGGPTT